MALDSAHLARTVRGQAEHLLYLLAAPHRDSADMHIAMCGTLRSMLCAAFKGFEMPTLFALAKELKHPLYAFSPLPPRSQMPRIGPGDFFTPAPVVVSDEPFEWMLGRSTYMLAAEWLDAPIGMIGETEAGGGRPALPPRYYSSRDILEWTANKDGAAHYQSDRDPCLEEVKNQMQISGQYSVVGPNGIVQTVTESDGIAVRSAILQIAEWTAKQARILLQRYEAQRAGSL